MEASLSHGSIPQKRIVPSDVPDASICPLGEKATHETQSVCPSSVCNRVPSLTRHKRMVLLLGNPAAKICPLGEKATPSVVSSACDCNRVPSLTRHKRMVSSPET